MERKPVLPAVTNEGNLWNPSEAGGAATVPTAEPLPPGWQDLGLLGMGGMGEVRAVREPELGRVVALKTLRPGLSGSEDAIARFLAESRAAAALQHPGIVAVFRAGVLPDGRPFYTMPRFGERTFAHLLGGDPSSLTTMLSRAMEAVAYAHARGTVHRDLKPENVLIGEFGEVIVADWGLARGEPGGDAVSGEGTLAGTVLGTPGWMAPEQARGETADARADVYALGRMLAAIWAREPRMPSPLRSIVARATEQEPARRYASAEALRADLAAWQRGALVSAHRYTALERLNVRMQPYRHVVIPALVALTVVLVAIVLAIARVARAGEVAADALRTRYRSEALDVLSDHGDPAAAQLYAAAALAHREDPVARGALMEARARPRPRLLSVERWEHFDLKDCWGGLAYRTGALPSCFYKDGGVRVWRNPHDEGITRNDAAGIVNTALDPTGRTVALQLTAELLLWELETDQVRSIGTFPRGRDQLWVGPDRLLRAAGDCGLALLVPSTGQTLTTLPEMCASARNSPLAQSPSGALLAVSGAYRGEEGVFVWRLNADQDGLDLACAWHRPLELLGALKVNDQGLIATVDGSTNFGEVEVRRFACETGRSLPVLTLSTFQAMAWLSGDVLAIARGRELWRVGTGGRDELLLPDGVLRDGVSADAVFTESGQVLQFEPLGPARLFVKDNFAVAPEGPPRALTSSSVRIEGGHFLSLEGGYIDGAGLLGPEGEVFGSEGNTLRAWTADGALRSETSVPGQPIELSVHAGLLAVRYADLNQVDVLDARTLTLLTRVAWEQRIRGALFDTEGHLAVFGYALGLRIYDPRSGALLAGHGSPAHEYTAALPLAGGWLLMERTNNELLQLKPETGEMSVLDTLPSAGTSLAVVGPYVAIGTADGTIYLRNSTGTLAIIPAFESPVLHLEASPDGRRLYGIDQRHALGQWDLEDLTLDPADVPDEVARSTGLRLIDGDVVATDQLSLP